jgi:hypothetical protein
LEFIPNRLSAFRYINIQKTFESASENKGFFALQSKKKGYNKKILPAALKIHSATLCGLYAPQAKRHVLRI